MVALELKSGGHQRQFYCFMLNHHIIFEMFKPGPKWLIDQPALLFWLKTYETVLVKICADCAANVPSPFTINSITTSYVGDVHRC